VRYFGEVASSPVGKRTIYLTKGPGFGSGRHPTTRMCLRLLEKCLDRCSCKKILDAGTGNGILAIAAARLGARNVTAVEIDRESAETARENLLLNRVAACAHVECMDVRRVHGMFDMVIANLSPVHANEIGIILEKHLCCGGCMILSGLSGFEKERVLRSLTGSRKLRLAEDLWEDGWSAVAMEKPFRLSRARQAGRKHDSFAGRGEIRSVCHVNTEMHRGSHPRLH